MLSAMLTHATAVQRLEGRASPAHELAEVGGELGGVVLGLGAAGMPVGAEAELALGRELEVGGTRGELGRERGEDAARTSGKAGVPRAGLCRLQKPPQSGA